MIRQPRNDLRTNYLRRIYLPLIVAAFAAAPLSARPMGKAATNATTQSVEAMPEAFAIFQTVNPFSLKKLTGGGGGPATASAGGPEASIVLSGVVQCGAGWTAFFAGGPGNAMLMVSVGDAIARGRLSSVDLDSVTYDIEGHGQRVEIGQNLNGQTPASKPASAAPPGAPGANTPGNPPGGSPNGQPGGPSGKHRPHPSPQPDQPSAPSSEQQDQQP